MLSVGLWQRVRVAALAFGIAASLLAAAETQSGISPQLSSLLHRVFDRNPRDIGVAVAHVHRYQIQAGDLPRTVSVVVPALHLSSPSRLANASWQNPQRPWPERFVITDGSPGAQMMLVDQRPGSLLSVLLDQFVSEMLGRGLNLADPEVLLEELRSGTRALFESSRAKLLGANNHPTLKRGENVLSPSAQRLFEDYEAKLISADVWLSEDFRPLLPFEFYIANPGEILCIHKALLASLILQRWGVAHVFRAGFASQGEPSYLTTGHSIIELADGRILDPTWELLKPATRHPRHPDWIAGAGWWWTAYSHFPYVILD